MIYRLRIFLLCRLYLLFLAIVIEGLDVILDENKWIVVDNDLLQISFFRKAQNCPNKKSILGGQFSTSKSGALPKNWLVKKILEGVSCWANEAEQNKMGPEMGVIFAFQ